MIRLKYFLPLLMTGILLSGCIKENTSNQKIQGKSALRGVWLTNVDSEVLKSRQNIIKAVELCHKNGINAIFAVVWNKAMTMYPSAVMEKEFGMKIDPLYIERDPLKELIEEAHKREIKVFAWFEFGFSSSFKADGGHILQKRPEWMSKDVNGMLTAKNGFEWMNAFHPDVQNFMISLFTEVVKNYKVDGVQGDDRLPALPSEGGYDEYTVNLYKAEHNGAEPPKDSKDSAWVQWRSDKLTDFLGRLHKMVKDINKDIIVSMSPSIYPWSKEEYLQDWPKWIEKGYVDLMVPQFYRYNIADYEKAIHEAVHNYVPENYKTRFYPGVLLKVGKYHPEEKLLLDMITVNREHGLEGEVYFFYEGMKKYADLFSKKIYNDKAVFPDFINKTTK